MAELDENRVYRLTGRGAGRSLQAVFAADYADDAEVEVYIARPSATTAT